MEAFPIGEIRLSNGKGDFGVVIKKENIADSAYGINHMEGILLQDEENRIFASKWTEGGPLDMRIENIRIWQQGETGAEGEEQADSDQVQSVQMEEKICPEIKSGAKNIAEVLTECEQRNESVEQAHNETMQATEIPVRNVFPVYDWEIIWEKLVKNHTIYMPFEDEKAECVQIELKDLRELPKRYWYLGNNSFMLHGFFNYHYLLVGRTGEGRWFMGVPGIYQRQERVMAAVFGFPEFMAAASEQDENEKSEPINRFGCWYRYIEE